MNFTITINASTPEELSAIVNRLNGVGTVQAPVVVTPAVQDQPSYPQQQAIAPTVSPQAMQPGFTLDPSAQYHQPQTGYGQAPVQPVQQQPVQNQAPVQQPQPGQVPLSTAPAYTMEGLGMAAGPFVDAGRGPELTAWLEQYGAKSLMQLDKSRYGEFATYLRSLGAKL